jgi:hypothetical protein
VSIKVGDLVMLIKTCGCHTNTNVAGYISVVSKITAVTDMPCQNCGKQWPSSVNFPIGKWGDACVPASWVKKIPPLDELEKEQERKEITA